MLRKLFGLIYFLFSIFILLTIFRNRTNIELIVIFITTIFMFVFLKKGKEFKLDNKMVNLLIIISIIIRFGLVFLNYGEVYSDYAKFFYGSVEFYQFGTISKYVSVFPHLISYIASIGLVFKIFGTSYQAVIIFNIVFDLISAFVLKKMFNSKKVALFWLLNPINIIWCSICHPVVITNTFFIISIFVFYNLIKNLNNNKKVYILSIILGIVLSITNLFRPIMIIFIIALTIYFLLNLTKDNLKKTFIILGLIILVFFSCNNLSTNIYKNFIDNSIASKTYGWSMYIGANIDSNGSWNQRQQIELDEMLASEATPTEIHAHFFNKAIDLYKSNGLVNNIKLFIKKVMVMVGGPDWLSAAVFNLMMATPFNDNVFSIIKLLTLIPYYLLVLFNLLIAYINLKSKRSDFSFLLQLFIIGMITSHMFVEVAERYSLPLLVPYTILIIISGKKCFKLLNNNKNLLININVIQKFIKIYKLKKEVINYLIFGFLTTIINLFTYYILTITFLDTKNGLELQIANIISWVIAFVFAYITNRKFVFDSNNNKMKELVNFFFARITTLIFDMIIMYLGVNVLLFNDKLVKILSQLIVIFCNYVFSKLFVFKKN